MPPAHNKLRVILTGATGFLGSHVAAAFQTHRHAVTAIVRPQSRTDFLQQLGVTLQPAQLDQVAPLHQIMRGADVVIHAAATVHLQQHWSEFLQATVHTTGNVLHAATQAGVPHFIHISTVGVYGWPRPDGLPFTESDGYGRPYRWNYYSRAKIEAEKLVRAASGIQTTILRPTWIYGPRDVASVGPIVKALRQQRYRWIGSANNSLSLVYVTDVVQAVVLAATNPTSYGQIYNVAADELAGTQREFIAQLCQLLSLPEPRRTIPYQAAHNLGYISECVAHLSRYRMRPPLNRLSVLLLGGQRRYANQKIKTELGWQPQINLSDGLHRTTGWYRLCAST